MFNRPQPVSGRSGHQSASLYIFVLTAAPGRHHPMPPSTSASPPTRAVNTDRTHELSLPSSSIASTSTATAPVPTTHRRYKDTLKNSLKELHINPETWEVLAQNKPARRREVKTSLVIHATNRIVAAETKREALRTQATFQHNTPSIRQRLLRSYRKPAPNGASVTSNRNVAVPPPPPQPPPSPPPPPSALPQPLYRPQRPASPPPDFPHVPTDGATSDVLPPPTITTNTPPPATWTRFIPVLFAIAHSPHKSAWSVACEPIA
nr:unnamed protein product [Spirometra erinaceieuropaei]